MNKEEPKCKMNGNGTKYWRLKNGTRHRLDGPAVVYADGSKGWYINDVYVPSTYQYLHVGHTILWTVDVIALVIKQVNPVLFQILIGNKKEYLFSLYNYEGSEG